MQAGPEAVPRNTERRLLDLLLRQRRQQRAHVLAPRTVDLVGAVHGEGDVRLQERELVRGQAPREQPLLEEEAEDVEVDRAPRELGDLARNGEPDAGEDAESAARAFLGDEAFDLLTALDAEE